MGLFKKVFERPAKNGNEYIDLDEYVQESFTSDAAATMHVRVAEIHKYDELRALADSVYKGNLLLLDFSPIAGDEVILKRVTGDLKRLTADVGGDIAGLGKSMMIVTPTGVKIDRTKFKVATH